VIVKEITIPRKSIIPFAAIVMRESESSYRYISS
jgi:hypothetical protein